MRKFPSQINTAIAIIVIVLVLRVVLRSKGGVGGHKKPVISPEDLRPGIDYGTIATDLYNAFDGFDWTSTKKRAIINAMALSDPEFIHVYNIYNQQFTKPPRTLKTDAAGEWIFGSGVNEFLNRFERLQLP